MNLIQRIIPITAMIALAIPGVAADEVADDLEKKLIAYWAPDNEAMTKIIREMGAGEEDVAGVLAEFAAITVHVEKGTVHLYTKQGVLSQPYEIVEADKEAGTLTVRGAVPPDAPNPEPGVPKAESMTVAIKGEQITVQGKVGQMPFVMKKIGEEEFLKRKAAVPADKVGP